MAARKGIRLTAEHARRIADGSLTLSELGAELGISKRTVHYHLRKLGVAGPADANDRPAPAADASPGSTSTTSPPTKRRQRAASARPAATASSLPPALIGAPSAPAAPASIDLSDDADLTELARRELANVALLGIAECRAILVRGKLGPQGLKAAVAAAALADQLLRRAGHDIASTADQVAPKMLIIEMTAAEVEATRAAVEAEHRENFGIVEDDAELAEDMDDAPRLAAA